MAMGSALLRGAAGQSSVADVRLEIAPYTLEVSPKRRFQGPVRWTPRFSHDRAGENSGRYDREIFLGLHDWGGHFQGGDDGYMNPVYDVSTINGKMLGFGEPIRVKQGERLLMHVLNSSPTEVHWVALAGHSFKVVSLDGNPVSQPPDRSNAAPIPRGESQCGC